MKKQLFLFLTFAMFALSAITVFAEDESSSVRITEDKTIEYDKEEFQNNKEDSKRNICVIFLILSIVFFILGFLPFISTNIRISCMAFSILLLVGFVMACVMRKKKLEKVKNIEQKEDFPMQEIGMGETVFFENLLLQPQGDNGMISKNEIEARMR